jgi:hypothetical protein
MVTMTSNAGLHNMSLLHWIEQVLERLAPNISNFATAIASMASVVASISWLISRALSFVGDHNKI